MRLCAPILVISFFLGGIISAEAETVPVEPKESSSSEQIEVSADNTLEWYQDKNLFVARGNAKVVRGDLTITADNLTAHQREKPKGEGKTEKKQADSDTGDIDRMTADGNVVILKSTARITGDHAVEDVDKHVLVLTGNNLRYETDKQVVTATRSLEYWDATKTAVARGNAVAVQGDRHVSGDVLTAEFRDEGKQKDQLNKLTAVGNVTVITKSDITRGDKGVYDAARDIAVITGHVRITRADGTELTGDVGESDFASNRSRLLNEGSGRVRILLPAKATSKTNKSTTTKTQGGTP